VNLGFTWLIELLNNLRDGLWRGWREALLSSSGSDDDRSFVAILVAALSASAAIIAVGATSASRCPLEFARRVSDRFIA
jgi:hypothetical protein